MGTLRRSSRWEEGGVAQPAQKNLLFATATASDNELSRGIIPLSHPPRCSIFMVDLSRQPAIILV